MASVDVVSQVLRIGMAANTLGYLTNPRGPTGLKPKDP